ncbi:MULTISPECIES: lipopolysaccharide biosynthesis protein [unclassified Streptomyces]|uniref:lipopolysaccharide biosynthesis protein n=1 Tax=unclassified Streptomyces TaxID=2593676 RepID=UPI001BEAB57A|nr:MULTISPECIES: lipopolysaccharide biosynthesis protein [unclassified Streptomyces]MBT2403958.1 lipopolysaccharide biosynthesis protein [Streptomyces sp. ISL-21]MBT2608387.1 lipopolysaccharide biosynthesis protein [Streptomyces sp. ISL-87]
MIETNRPAAAPAEDEPDLLRDQFRQLLRYRRLIGAGIAVGLLGGVYLGISTADTYVATADVVLRAPTDDPFNPSLAPDKAINIGSERQVALSSSIANEAAKKLGVSAAGFSALRSGLQVTNPPQTMVLRFTYTASSPKEAAKRANAMTEAYLLKRREALDITRDQMVKGYKDQRDPVSKQLDELAKEIARMPAGATRDAATSSKTDLQSEVGRYNGNITKLEALDMTPGRVTSAAVPPTSPDGPGLPMSLALGAAVGLALGLLAAWVRLVFDPAPRSEGDVARALRAPVLGCLPRDKTGGGPLLAAGEEDPRLAEEYRSVAFRLAYDSRFADRRRLLVVAPRGSSETAAAVAVNLAASFAETGKDVLLIEADLRTPVLASQLPTDAGGRPRWSQMPGGPAAGGHPGQHGDSDWPDGRQLVVDAGESGAFDLIPGERVRNVARALTSPRATRLVSEADSPNSTVVVLAPPVLSYADALALVDRVDGVLVVCDPRAVHRSDLSRIRELISGAGGTVLGAVLHAPVPGEKRGRGKQKGGREGGRAGAADAPAPRPPAQPLPRVAAEPEQHVPGDGTDTVALRTVRTGRR